MKLCTACNKKKPKDQFSSNSYRKDGLNWQCKTCHSKYRKKHYQNNKKKYIDKASKYKEEQVILFKKFKEQFSCIVCKENEISCLDFHHIDPTIKEFAVGARIKNSAKKAIAETKKCVVLCSNCHRKLHAGVIQLVE